MHLLNCTKNFLSRGSFKQIATGAHLERLKNTVAIVINGEHNHLQLGQTRLELAHALDPGHAGEVHVHQHNIRRAPWHRFQGLLTGTKRAGALEAFGLADQSREIFAHFLVVFHNGNSDRHCYFGVESD